MTSAFTVPPSALHDPDYTSSSHPTGSAPNQQRPSATSADSSHLSPALSRVNSDSLSPSVNLETPDGSNSTLSQYQSSDFGDLDEDPFFGVDFNLGGGSPTFLGDPAAGLDQAVFAETPPSGNDMSYNENGSTYPLTPEQTASIHTTSPRSDLTPAVTGSIAERLPDSISPRELQKPFKPSRIVTDAAQLTPSQSSSCRSSEDGLAPTAVAMACQSPRVTVSMWGKDNDAPIHTIERTFGDSPTTVRGGFHSAGDLISADDTTPIAAPRDSIGRWQRDPTTGHAGLDPGQRPAGEIASINEIVSRREAQERNVEVDRWLTDKFDDLSVGPEETSPDDLRALNDPENTVNGDIPFGQHTENRYIPGQTYYGGPGGEMTPEDYNIIRANHKWEDAPVFHGISDEGRYQPQTSRDAIAKWERMCRDTDSIVSRAATWGTRRRSLPSIMDFDVTSGNFLKKLSMSRGDKGNKPGGLFKDLQNLVRRPSAASLLKRNRNSIAHEEDSLPGSDSRGSQDSKRESLPHLAPPARMSSWGKKPTPSINTALVSMGNNAASIGTTHARSGSISATPITSPKSPFGGLSVKASLRRPRSKSDLPKVSPVATAAATSAADSHPTLVSMWKQTGGPPVASLAKTNGVEYDEEEDDEDEAGEENDLKTEANIIDGITPNLAGFQQHVLALNPMLANSSIYLVDRIAHQQIVRYKHLLNAKVKHLQMGANCSSGSLCVALGGVASILDQNGDTRDLDPLSTKFPDEEEGTPTEGVITHESFPQDIPMPPTQRLPAEFECQLCFQSKKFQKPSDWTKHVHEDVQPFTCTWDKCRDPKIFKRKADWVRHENEGHRHLEWWTCDVEDCRHTCYRRDNFLQHLVREHKFLEPKVKTKAAMKRAGGIDPTWQKVEQCHVETPKRPQEEPCRFCGKIFPTWKKLTVHLAKHMEHISLPVLRLVAVKAKELAADTIISPVQDPPPRHHHMIPQTVNQSPPIMQYPVGPHQLSPHQQQMAYQQQGQLIYSTMTQEQYQHQQAGYFQAPFESIGQNLQAPAVGLYSMNQGFEQSRQMQDIPVTTAAQYVQAPVPFMAPQTNGMGPFPQMNALGLQNHAVPMGGQMAFEGIMNPSSGHGSPFSGQGSVSPYSHSPNLNQNVGVGDGGWNEKRMSGYL